MHPIIFNQFEMQCQPASCASQFQIVPHIIKSAVKSKKEADKDIDYVSNLRDVREIQLILQQYRAVTTILAIFICKCT